MKVSFNFDGERVYLRLEVQDECERAIAKLIGTYSEAVVSVDYGRSEYGYTSYRDQEPKAVEIRLTQAVKCFSTGAACVRGCKPHEACSLTAQQSGDPRD